MYEGWQILIEWRPTYYDVTWGIKHWNKGEIEIHFGIKRLILGFKKV